MFRLALCLSLLFIGACVSDTTLSIPLSKDSVAISVPAHAPRRGPAAARVTLVEFSDFQCVYCAQAEPTVQRVLATYPNDVALVYMNFPLTSIHANAQRAAQAFLAAARQGQAWPMHDLMFQHHNDLSDANVVSWAQSLGMDIAQFNADRAGAEIADEIAQDKALAISLGVEATPTFFINGRKLPGAQPFSAFQQGIEEELGRTTSGQ
jgi:protein-disulfide isomerase